MASCLFSWGVALRPLLEMLVALAAPAVLLCCADADSLAAEPEPVEPVEPAELLLVAEEPEELLVAELEELLVAELELLVAELELLLLVAELLLRLLSCDALEELRDALLELLVAELLLRLLSCDALEELLVAELELRVAEELELLVDEPLLLRVWADTAEAETSDKASAAAAAASVNLLITFIDKCNTFWKSP
ncbi:MAG: hypothetical protein IKN13_05175 [Bacteroidales bacterium]|nr:hypothetical protein [Bacteroidales bacterium]